MAVFAEGRMVVVASMAVLRTLGIMVAQIAVVLQEMKDHLRHTCPLVQFHRAGTIREQSKSEKQMTHVRPRRYTSSPDRFQARSDGSWPVPGTG